MTIAKVTGAELLRAEADRDAAIDVARATAAKQITVVEVPTEPSQVVAIGYNQ